MDISERLRSEPIGKLFFKLALPSVLAQFVSLLYNIIDRMYLGHMEGIGSIALTGVGLCMPFICIINAFTMLIAQGGAPHASIAMGGRENDKAEKILGNCIVLLVVTSVCLTVIFLLAGRPLLILFGASEDTLPYAWGYMQIYVAGNLFVMGSLGLNQFITMQGFTNFSMFNVISGAVCNIILDPLFIFVFGLGVQGAAIATVLSQFLVTVMGLHFLLGKRTFLKIRKKYFLLDRKIVFPVFSLGMAPFIMQATEAAINSSFNYSLQKYGGDVAVGAMTIASTVMQMFWVPSSGIGQGAQPIISYNYGARDKERLKKIVKLLFIVMEAYFLLGWAAVEAFPGLFIKMFNSSSANLYDTSMMGLRVYVAALGLFGLQSSVQQVFVSVGQAKASMFIACLRKVILLIPFIFILPTLLSDKVFAVFLAEPISDLISVTTASCIFLVIFPKLLREIDKKQQ